MGSVMYINNKPLSDFNADMLLGYVIGGNDLKNIKSSGRDRTTSKLISQRIGEKNISLKVDFYGTRAERAKNKSQFDYECIKDIVVLSVGDGYEYHVTCTKLGDESPGTVMTEAEYTFSGFKKMGIVSIKAKEFFCLSTTPRTDCIFSVTVGRTTARYRLWNAYFLNVIAGDKIVFDGVNGRILINNSPRAAKCEWIDFPYLVPGTNTIVCDDTVTTEYYPTFL